MDINALKKVEIKTLNTATLVSSFQYIEGYLSKENTTAAEIKRSGGQRSLRYLRIVFNTGKLNIKENRAFN